ncbi:MAG: methionyl-tRNA formyltransferase [Bdellovibrionales bacterium RIFCSPHIGHO2_01_FULL_40_29]|nr:MAG: methionyl-tRNA formyltransferase [Bdellovibrionales bacterium RIFCSPHIGHO2_01_FULL_40_29]OFZ33825.1 MAG: methionyl-tRNA formyltransferase [Bdellovibrionales bacterium RIFCSPHIGHO2_02_FULL_40_15]
MIKVCFLGTPEFAALHLAALLSDSRFSVVGVVTQPDRPAGRKMQLTPSAVKVLAVEKSLPLLTPENLRKEPEAFKIIQSWNADIAVVVAFGQILSQDFLDSFKLGAVNVHGSLLPRWRGAAPIQRSIEAGDSETGVSLQKMVKKLDAGPVIGERHIKLDQEITAVQLYDQLAVLGCELLKTDLVDYCDGKKELLPQDETQVTLAAKIEKEESLIDWSLSAQKIHDKIRAFTMGPGTYCLFQGKRLKIHKTKVIKSELKSPAGSIQKIDSDGLVIQTGSGQLALLEVQPESKSKLAIGDFLKSHQLHKGDLFV